MADITLTRPAQGEKQTVRSAPDSRIVLNFPTDQTTMEKEADSLVFKFDDGSSVTLENFYQQYNAESIPEFQVDGQIIAGADFFSAFGPDIAPAAGPGGAQGGNRYHDYADLGLADGLNHLRELDWGMSTGGEREEREYSFGGRDFSSIEMNWVNSWDNGNPPLTPEEKDNSAAYAEGGKFVLKESHLEHGDSGARGSQYHDGDDPVSATSRLHITTVNSEFTSLDIAGKGYGLDALARGVEIGLDLDDDGETDVTVVFRYVGDNNIDVTVTLDNSVTHIDGAGNLLADALAGLNLTVHDNKGNSASGSMSVDVVDDNPEAYDDYQRATVEDADGNNVDTTFTGNVLTGEGNQGGAGTGADVSGADGYDPTHGLTWKPGDVTTKNEKKDDDPHADQDFNTEFYLTGDGPYTVMDHNGEKVVGQITLNDDGSYEFTVDKTYEPEHGDHTINIPYTVMDSDGDTSDAVLHITIENVNDRPDIVISQGEVKEEGVYAEGERGSGLHLLHDGSHGTADENTATTDGGAAPGRHQTAIHGQLQATDNDGDLLTFSPTPDAGGNFPSNVTLNGDGSYTVSGNYGDLTIKPDGSYDYALAGPDDPRYAAVNGLNEGDAPQEDFPVSVTDNSGAANSRGDGHIVITVHGTNDAPVITPNPVTGDKNFIAALVHEGVDEIADNSVSGKIDATDADSGADLKFGFELPDGTVADTVYVLADGSLSATHADDNYYGTVTIDKDGAYTFTVNDSAVCVQSLKETDTPRFDLRVVVEDEHGAYDRANLSVGIQGHNDRPVIIGGTTGAVKEEGVWGRDGDENTPTVDGGAAPGQHQTAIHGQLQATDAEGDPLTFSPTPDAEGNFPSNVTLNSDGSYTMSGNYGDLTIKPDGSYDYVLAGPGDPRYAAVNGLNEGDAPQENFPFSVTDESGADNNRADGHIEITVHGTNDKPTLSLEKDHYSFTDDISDTGSTIYKDKGFSGKFDIADPDADGQYSVAGGETDTHRFEVSHSGEAILGNTEGNSSHNETGGYGDTVTVQGTYGSLTVNLTTGEYSYNLYPHPDNNQPGLERRMLVDDLDEGDEYRETFTLTVKDLHGAWDSKEIVIDIRGANEKPQLDSFVHDVYEDGTRYVNDGRIDDRHERLVDEDPADGKPDIHSQNNPFTVGGNALENMQLGDGTAADHKFIWNDQQGNIKDGYGTVNTEYGTFTANDDGTYSFTLNNNAAAVQELNAGDLREVTVTYSYYDKDGDKAEGAVTIVIHGTNDDPTLTKSLTSQVELREKGYGGDLTPADNDGALVVNPNTANPGTPSKTDSFTVNDKDSGDSQFLTLILTDRNGPGDADDMPMTLLSGETAVTNGNLVSGYQVIHDGHLIGTLNVTASNTNGHDTTYSYTFTLDESGTDYLNVGDVLNFALNFVVKDASGAEIKQEVEISVKGTNDKPTLTLLQESADDFTVAGGKAELAINEGDALSSYTGQDVFSGSFKVEDPDADGGLNNIGNTFSGKANGGADSSFTSAGGDLVLQGQYGTLTVHPDGSYEYKLDKESRNGQDVYKLEGLREGQEFTEHFDIKAQDIHGAWSNSVPVEIKLTGSNDPIQELKNEPGHLNLKEAGFAASADGAAHGSANTPYSGNTAVAGKASDTGTDNFRVLDMDKGDVKHLTLTINGTEYNLGNGSVSGNVTTYTQATDYGTITIKGTASADGTTSYSYTYALDNSKPATQALSESEIVNQNCVIKVDDGHGSSVTHKFDAVIEGTNDKPAFAANSVVAGTVKEEGVYKAGKGDWGDVHEHDAANSKSSATGQLYATDPDSDNQGPDAQLTFGLVNGAAAGSDGSQKLGSEYGELIMRPDGSWTFQLDTTPGGKADQLAEGQNVNLTFKANVTDNHGATVETTITVTVQGTNDIPTLQVKYNGVGQDDQGHVYVKEDDMAHQSVSGTLTWNDVDTKDMQAGHDVRISFTGADGKTSSVVDLANNNADNHLEIQGQYGTLYYDRVGANGEGKWSYVLDNNKVQALNETDTRTETFSVMVRDQFGAWVEKPIIIDVRGTDDESNFDLSMLNPGQTIVEQGVITGTNDPNNAADHVSGYIKATDADNGDLIYQVQGLDGEWHTLTPGALPMTIVTEHGTVTITNNTDNDAPFKYTYELNNADPDINALYRNHDASDSFLVRAGTEGPGGEVVDSQMTERTVTISIAGSNDRPVFTGDSEIDYTYTGTDSVIPSGTFSGKLETTDPDANDHGSVEQGEGEYNLKVTVLGKVDAGTDKEHWESKNFIEVKGSDITVDGQHTLSPDTVYGTFEMRPDGTYTFNLTIAGKYMLTALGEDKHIEFSVTPRVIDEHGAWSDLEGGLKIKIQGGDYVGRGDSHAHKFDVNGEASYEHTIYEDGGDRGNNPAPGPNGFYEISGRITGLTTSCDEHGNTHTPYYDAENGSWDGYMVGQYGTLFIHPDGSYTYRLNNDMDAVQGLKPAASGNGVEGHNYLEENFKILVEDRGAGHDVFVPIKITINGTEDAPEMTLNSLTPDIEGGGGYFNAVEQVGDADNDGFFTDDSLYMKGEAVTYDKDIDDRENNNFHYSLAQEGSAAGDAGKEFVLAYADIGGQSVLVGKFVVHDDGKYEFIPHENTYMLDPGEQITVKADIWVNAEQDAQGNSDHATISVTITGTNSIPEMKGKVIDGLAEDDSAKAHVEGSIADLGSDADHSAVLQYYVVGGNQTGPTTWEGQYGTLTLRPDGSYDYTLHNDKVQGANVDNAFHDVFQVQVRDQYGATSEAKALDFQIDGKNDLPVISNVSANPAVTENNDGILQIGRGSMTVTDVDDTLTAANFTVGKGSLTAAADNSVLGDTAEGTYGNLIIDGYDADTGKLSYHYELDNVKADSLGRNAHPKDTFTILVDDGHGVLVPKVIEVTVNGVNDAPTLDAVSAIDANEATGAATGTPFIGHDVDTGDTVSFKVDGNVALSAAEKAANAVGNGYTDKVTGAHGTLYYNSANGANKYVPNGNVQEGVTEHDHFTVKSYDGLAYSAGQDLDVTVVGRGDAPEVSITGNAVLQAVDHETGATKVTLDLKVTDVDAGDHYTVRLSSGENADWNTATDGSAGLTGTYGILKLVNGKLQYEIRPDHVEGVRALQNGEQETETFTVWVKDDTGNLVPKDVTFTIKGTNDTPVISDVHGMGDVTENYAAADAITSSGSFTVADADDALNSLTATALNPAGKYGSLSVSYDSNGEVSYTYTLDPDKARALGAGQNGTETFTIKVTDGHGGVTNQQVQVKVIGSNDAPVVTVANGGQATLNEDADHIGASVKLGLTITDYDLNDKNFAVTLSQDDGAPANANAGLHGQYGTLKLVNGELVYTVDRSLGTNTGLQDVFKVMVLDEHSGYAEQIVTFTVNSYNEAPVVSVGSGLLIVDNGNIINDDGELAGQTLTGSLGLNIHDEETANADLVVTIDGKGAGQVIEGAYGHLTFDADGNYTYTLNGALDTMRALAKHEGVLDDTFKVMVTDEEGKSTTADFNVHLGADKLVAVSDITHIYNASDVDESYIFGTNGNDRITVNGADNVIYGGAGDDVISAAENGNHLFGGAGNDLFIFQGAAPGGSANYYHGGSGLDFMVGLDDMTTVNRLFDANDGPRHLDGIDVLLIGGSNVTSLSNLASLGLTEDGGKLNMDTRWTADAAVNAGQHPDGYTAYSAQVTNAQGQSETLTVLVNNEVIKSESGA